MANRSPDAGRHGSPAARRRRASSTLITAAMEPERVAPGMTTPDAAPDPGPDPDAPLDPDVPDLDLDIPVPASPAETNPDADTPDGTVEPPD
jgi:hypothetical protein